EYVLGTEAEALRAQLGEKQREALYLRDAHATMRSTFEKYMAAEMAQCKMHYQSQYAGRIAELEARLNQERQRQANRRVPKGCARGTATISTNGYH
ncbi:hypothetical protein KIPB_010711, partial [Kipferlia bialata]